MTDSTRNEEDIRRDINTITDELKEILEYANQQLNIIKKDTELEEDYLQYDFDIVMIHTRPMLCEQIEIYKRIIENITCVLCENTNDAFTEHKRYRYNYRRAFCSIKIPDIEHPLKRYTNSNDEEVWKIEHPILYSQLVLYQKEKQMCENILRLYQLKIEQDKSISI
jgi:hypothetical protein